MSLFDHFEIDFSKMRVLLVEDNEFELNVAKAALQELGFETILVAGDGREAIKMMEYFPQINLIISDWNMPDVNGLELLNIAHERWPGVPFVMITGNDSVDHVAEAMRSGVFAYILKPFTLAGLRQKIIAAIRRYLAGGGDHEIEDRAQFQETIDQIESVAKFTGDKKNNSSGAEIARFEDAIESVLFSTEHRSQNETELDRTAFAVTNLPGLDNATQGYLKMLVDQTTDFVKKVGHPDAVQLEVIKLHAEIIREVSSGQLKGKSKNTGPDLFRALSTAMEMALN